MTIVGVIADTHIPERVRRLPPEVMPVFSRAGVDVILHAGDVCVPGLLRQLEEIAPVYAVRGNRDWVRLGHLPLSLILNFDGVNLALAHGHGHWLNYLLDKVHYVMFGVQEWRYQHRLLVEFPQAKVIVYGHLHAPHNDWIDGKLLFNPGSACCPMKGFAPSVGLLHIHSRGEVEGEIIPL